jgi:hypothetical protein
MGQNRTPAVIPNQPPQNASSDTSEDARARREAAMDAIRRRLQQLEQIHAAETATMR